MCYVSPCDEQQRALRAILANPVLPKCHVIFASAQGTRNHVMLSHYAQGTRSHVMLSQRWIVLCAVLCASWRMKKKKSGNCCAHIWAYIEARIHVLRFLFACLVYAMAFWGEEGGGYDGGEIGIVETPTPHAEAHVTVRSPP